MRFRTAFPLALAALALSAPAPAESLLDYNGQCVPFARKASGIQIYGDAWTWWGQAAGRYERGSRPRVGAVLAFAKAANLPLGHVAVVSRIVDKRVLMITHANWSRFDDGLRGRPEQDVTLFDVSERGDWTRVRVWFRGNRGLGSSTYTAHGFIYAKGRPAPELSSRNPDYVGSLIDAYAAR